MKNCLLVAICVSGGVAVCVALGVGIAIFAFTPTQTLLIHNDLPFTIEASICGSDPTLIASGETEKVDPNLEDSHSACAVYSYLGAAYVGCLPTPPTAYKDGAVINVSELDRQISEQKCGD